MANISGDNNDNLLIGSQEPDLMEGFGGNDTIFGEAGDDT